MNNIYYIYNALLCVLCFSLPFEEYVRAVPNIIVIALILLFPFLKENRLKKSKIKLFVVLAFFIVYIVLKSLVLKTFIDDLFVLEKLSLAFILMFLFAPIKNTKAIEFSFIIAVFLSVLLSILNIYKYSSSLGEFSFSNGAKINEVLIIERLYFGFLCVISFILCLKYIGSQNKFLHGFMVLNGIICFAFVLVVSARIALVTVVVVISIQILKRFKKRIAIGLLFLVMLLITGAFFMNDNLGKRLLHSNDIYRKTFFEKIATHEPRFLIWSCSYSIFKNDNIFLGSGFKNTITQLSSCFDNTIKKERKKDWYLAQKFNTHNQFIDFLLSSGLLGLVLFSYILYLILKQSNCNIYDISLFIALLLFSMVENIFHRQIGAYLFALIITLISNKHLSTLTGNDQNYRK